MVSLGVKQFMDPYYQGFAAQVAFFILLSLVPTIIIISRALSIFNIPESIFDSIVSRYATGAVADTIRSLFTNKSSMGNNVLLIILALWSASRAQFACMRIANYTYSGGREVGNFWKERFRSLFTMFLFLLTMIIIILLLVYGNYVLEIIFGTVVEHKILTMIWNVVKWPLIAILYFFVVWYQNYIFPRKRMSWRDVLPGSFIAAAGMVVVTFFYAVYAKYIANYDLLYGSISSIAILLFWFYLMSWVLFIGILFNKVLIDTRYLRPKKKKNEDEDLELDILAEESAETEEKGEI